jgi:hypothetical protein
VIYATIGKSYPAPLVMGPPGGLPSEIVSQDLEKTLTVSL